MVIAGMTSIYILAEGRKELVKNSIVDKAERLKTREKKTSSKEEWEDGHIG